MMITEAQKVKAHNALYAAGFKPLTNLRQTWEKAVDGEPCFMVYLQAAEWLICEDDDGGPDDGLNECGGYSDAGFDKFLKTVKGLANA
jgi:hypothetical protein